MTLIDMNSGSSPMPLVALDGLDFSDHYAVLDTDRVVYRNGQMPLSKNDFGDTELHRLWFERNPSIYTFLVWERQLVGYVCAMPLIESAFQKVLEGVSSDGQIDAEEISLYDRPGNYKLYLCSVGILPDFRQKIRGLGALHESLRNKTDRLRKRGIVISELASVVWTREGAAICRAFGMTLLRNHQRRGDVYYRTLPEGRIPG